MLEKERVICPISFDDPTIRVGRLPNQEVSKQEPKGFSFERLVKKEPPTTNWLEAVIQPSEVGCITLPQESDLLQNMNNYPQLFPIETYIENTEPLSEAAKYAFEEELGRARAKLIADVEKDKVREKTVVANHLTSLGFTRGKFFSDQTVNYQRIAEGVILNARKWVFGKEKFFMLEVQNARTGETKKTEVLSLNSLEEDRYAENIISQYFYPSDSRVYAKTSVKDFKSRLYEFLDCIEPEKISEYVGWKKTEFYEFVDGTNYPFLESQIASLRKPLVFKSIVPERLIADLCNELNEKDFDNRIRFLIGYGLVNWLSSLCAYKRSSYFEVLLLGEENVCRKYAHAFLKFLSRDCGEDILNLQDITEKYVAEYVQTVQDDTLVFDCYEASRKSSLLKSIVSRKSVFNFKIEKPLVVLQRWSNPQIDFSGFICVDLYGFEKSKKFFDDMEAFKGLILETVEKAKPETLVAEVRDYESYKENFVKVLQLTRTVLMKSGVSLSLATYFTNELEKGISVVQQQTERNRELAVMAFRQRFRKLVDMGEIRILTFSKDVNAENQEFSIWIKGNVACLPVKYLRRVILPLMEISFGEFKEIRDILISQNLLFTYDSQKELTRDVVLPAGKRVNAYVISYRYLFDDTE